MSTAEIHKSLKEKAWEEFKLYWIITLYLCVFFASFNAYRRLILADSALTYASYGFRLVEALIIAKVILIGEAMHIGKRHEGRQLAVLVAIKSILFGVFIALFNVLERVVEGLLHREDLAAILHRVFENSTSEMLARTLVMMVALVPFFAFLELGRVLGPGKLWGLFFSRPAARG